MRESTTAMETNEVQSAVYTRIKLKLSILSMFLEIILLGLGAFFIAQPVYRLLSHNIHNEYVLLIAFFGVFGSMLSLILLPLTFYKSYVIEHAFNLSNQTFYDWCIDGFKSLMVSAAIGLPLIVVFYFLIKSSVYWWLYFAVVVFLFAIVLAKIAPVIILPLFYTLTAIDNDMLKHSLSDLMNKHGLIVKGIYSFNMSKDTKKANAAFTGIGKTRRILLSDTLLNEFSADEVRTVFAHELGHYVHKHIIKNLVVSSIIIIVSFFLCSAAYEMTLRHAGFAQRYDIAALPIVFFYLSIFGLLLMPVLNTISRYYETQADVFALAATNDPDSFISTMEKLSSMNLSQKDQHPIIEFLLYSHPAIARRIQLAKNYRGIGT